MKIIQSSIACLLALVLSGCANTNQSASENMPVLTSTGELSGSVSASVNASPQRLAGDSQFKQFQDQGRDKFAEIKPNPQKITEDEPVSTFSIDVDTASYSFVRSSLNRNVLPQKDAVRVEELITSPSRCFNFTTSFNAI